MRIDVGDLVKCASRQDKLGVVIDRKIANEGLQSSMHTRHIVDVYPQVYYVYICGEGRVGPLHATEVSLQQHRVC